MLRKFNITLGSTPLSEIQASLNKSLFAYEHHAQEMVARVTISSERTPLELVVVEAVDLHFDGVQVYLDEILNTACNMGFKMCPPEAALLLRLVYTDQRPNEWLKVISSPVHVGQIPYVFALHKYAGTLRLGSHSAAWTSPFLTTACFAFENAR